MVMLLTAMVPVLFSSCGDDEPVNPTPTPEPTPFEELIIGEWDMTRMDYDMEYEGETEVGSEYFDEEDWIWEFDGNNLTMYEGGWSDDPSRYEIDGDKLYTEYATNYMAQYFKITTLNNTKLVLEVSYRYEGAKVKYTFVFKRI